MPRFWHIVYAYASLSWFASHRPDDARSDEMRNLLWKKTRQLEEEQELRRQEAFEEEQYEREAYLRVLKRNVFVIVAIAALLLIAWQRKRTFDQKGLHKKRDYVRDEYRYY